MISPISRNSHNSVQSRDSANPMIVAYSNNSVAPSNTNVMFNNTSITMFVLFGCSSRIIKNINSTITILNNPTTTAKSQMILQNRILGLLLVLALFRIGQ